MNSVVSLVPFSSGPQPSLHVARAGQAPSWLFLHGAGTSPTVFSGVVRRLASDIVPLSHDLAQHTTGPAESDHALLDGDVATVRRLVESQASPLVIVGHSYGAVIALELSRRHPELVARLVLIEPLALHLLGQRDHDAGTAALQALATRVAELVQQGARLEAARLLSSYWDESSWAKLPDEQRARFAEGMPRIMRALRELAALRVSLEDYRQAVHVPTVLIRGARSTPPTRWIAAQLARTLPQGMLFDVAGAGHMCPVSHPHELAFLLRRMVLERAREFSPARD